MNFCITTDSGADLPLSYCQTHDITVLPLAFTIEGQTYHGSGAMDHKVFLSRAFRAGALPAFRRQSRGYRSAVPHVCGAG